MRRGEDAGLTTTELAVLMPALILMVLVPFQIALWWHATQVAEGAARHAVNVAQASGGTDADGTAAAEMFISTAGNLVDPAVTVTRTGATVTATVGGRAPLLVPGLDWEVHATAAGGEERFLREDER